MRKTFLGIPYGRDEAPKQETFTEVPTDNTDKKLSFSTPFLKIGKGNLGSPFISPYYTIGGIVQFGNDNLYPQILDQMYYTSPIHSTCIDFIGNAAVGGGYTYAIPAKTGVESVDLYTFEKKNKFKKMVRNLATDFLIHKRVCIVVKKDVNGKFKSFHRLNPATVRNNQTVDKFIYCKDWSRRTGLIEYNRYTPNGKELESLYVYQEETVGQDIYPLPSYISILNDVYLDGEIAFLQKSNIQNSIWPSIVIRVPKEFASEDERKSFKDGLTSNSGAQGAGRIMVLQGNGMDNTPEVTPIASNGNDKLFDTTLDSIMNKICIAHGINPAIMGIKVAGSLGNAQELQMSYSIFEKNVVMPLRNELTEIYDELLDIAGIKNSILINNFQIIDSQVAEQTGMSASKPGDSVKSEEMATDAPLPVNESIKNLTGKQHQAMLRIIRQYGQGKINKEQATVLLRNSLGLSQEDIDLMLSE